MSDLSAGPASAAPEAPAVEQTQAEAPAALSPVIQTDSEQALNDELTKVWEKNNPAEDGLVSPEEAEAPSNRDEKGRFVSTKPEAPKKTDQPAAEKTEPEEKPAIESPQSWSDEDKAHWAKVPPEAQAIIARREAEAHKAITRAGEEKKAFEPIRNMVESGRDLYQALNMRPEQAIDAMFRIERGLRENPTKTIHDIAKAYGVDISGAKPGQQQQQANPEVQQLKRQVAELTSYLTAQQRRSYEDSQNELARTIVDFSQSEAVKADWADVEEDMPGLIYSIRQRDPEKPVQKVLEEAFQKAVWANDTVRTRRLESERKAAEAKRKEEEAKRVTDARRSAGINVNGGPANTAPKDNDEALRAIALKHYGRAR